MNPDLGYLGFRLQSQIIRHRIEQCESDRIIVCIAKNAAIKTYSIKPFDNGPWNRHALSTHPLKRLFIYLDAMLLSLARRLLDLERSLNAVRGDLWPRAL